MPRSESLEIPNSYELRITLKPMNYLDLIKYFQFDLPIYIFLFSLLSLFTVMVIIVFWFLNKMISSVKHKPWLKIKDSINVIFRPVFMGTLFTTIPFMSCIFFVVILYSSSIFSVDTFFFRYDTSTVTDAIKSSVKKGRSGLIICIVGTFFIHYGSCLIIPSPSADQEKVIKMTIL